MRAVIRGFLEEAYVLFNGDVDAVKTFKRDTTKIANKKAELDRLQSSFNDLEADESEILAYRKLPGEIKALEEGSNTLIVTLVHPGEDGNVNVLKPLRLGEGPEQGYVAKTDGFFEAGLFKKIALGEFGIRAAITDTDKANPFGVFFRRVLSGVFNAAVKSSIAGIGNVLVSNAASELSSDIGEAIEGNGGEQTTVVGVSSLAKFVVVGSGGLTLANPGNGLQYVRGELSLPLRFPGLIETSPNRYRKPGSSNGKVVIRLEAESID